MKTLLFILSLIPLTSLSQPRVIAKLYEDSTGDYVIEYFCKDTGSTKVDIKVYRKARYRDIKGTYHRMRPIGILRDRLVVVKEDCVYDDPSQWVSLAREGHKK